VRVKFERFGLEGFLGTPEPAERGNHHFRCPDVAGFRAALAELGFRMRERTGGAWDAREPVARLSLHCKHFAGWPEDLVQAHVDPHGVGGALTSLLHLLDYSGYRDEERISRLLLG
jgi:hypothetical protein